MVAIGDTLKYLKDIKIVIAIIFAFDSAENYSSFDKPPQA